jgi:uncharacterized protein DUF4129
MPLASRTSPVLLCVVAIALATGAAATLVTSATRPVGVAIASPASFTFSDTVLGILLLLPFLAALGALIYRRIREGGFGMPGRVVITGFVVLLLLVGFAVSGHYLNPGAPGGVTSGGGGGGGGNGSHNGTGGGGTGGTGGTGFPSLQSAGLSSGLLILFVLVAALALAGLLVPALMGWSADRRAYREAATSPSARSGAQGALASAQSDLNSGMDPRAVIERLYTRLLERVVPVSGDLSTWTPEEIRSEQLVPLGVRPAAADSLTRLFEEARYSSHPIGPESANRVRSAVNAAAADLARIPAAR